MTTRYADTMRQNAREQLQDLDDSSGSPLLHQAIIDALAALDRKDPTALGAIAERLFAMAGPRGPAD